MTKAHLDKLASQIMISHLDNDDEEDERFLEQLKSQILQKKSIRQELIVKEEEDQNYF